MPGMWDWLDLIDSGPTPTGPALAPLGVLANAEKPAIGNPLIAMQVANARAANPRPDISNSFVDPTWTQAYQTLVSALQQHFPVPALSQAMTPQQRYESSLPARDAGVNFALSVGPHANPGSVRQILDAYHGTKSSFGSFDLRRAGKSDPGLVGKAVYLSPSPEQASQFAMNPHYGSGQSPNVMPVRVTLENPLVIQDGILPDGRRLSDLHPGGITKDSASAINKWMRDHGYDGAIFKLGDEIVQIAALNAKSVASRFQK